MDDKTKLHNIAIKAVTNSPEATPEAKAIANSVLDLHDWVGVFRKEFTKIENVLSGHDNSIGQASSRMQSIEHQMRLLAQAIESLKSELQSVTARVALLCVRNTETSDRQDAP